MLFNHLIQTAHVRQRVSAQPGTKIELGSVFDALQVPPLPSPYCFLGACAHVGD